MANDVQYKKILEGAELYTVVIQDICMCVTSYVKEFNVYRITKHINNLPKSKRNVLS